MSNFTIDRGDRVALRRPKRSRQIHAHPSLLTGVEQPTSGTVQLGHNVLAEYFAQDQYKVLDPEARMLDDISRAAIKVPELALRSLLGCFLFSGDDVFKPLGVLSGGERNRFALARILVSPSNFLLLDEPTNHLDMRAKDVLLEAIESFSGTVIFVSHDRYFLDRLATKVLEVKDGSIEIYPGTYAEFVRDREEAALSPRPTLLSADRVPLSPDPATLSPRPAAPTPDAAEGPAKVKRLNPIQAPSKWKTAAISSKKKSRASNPPSPTPKAL